MSDSLRDQLLGLGFKPSPKPEPKPEQRQARATPCRPESGSGAQRRKPSRNAEVHAAGQGKSQRPARTREEIDLAKAYAIRAQREKDERIEAERLKQEQARQRREAKAKLAELLQGQALNDPTSEIARHFDYGGKIKRVHVTAAQLKALNAGDLGVIQLDGRYLLVTAALLEQAAAIFPPAIALKVDPDAAAVDDPYADPQYQVPDDLIW